MYVYMCKLMPAMIVHHKVFCVCHTHTHIGYKCVQMSLPAESVLQTRTHSGTHACSFWKLVINGSSKVITSASHTFATEVLMPACCWKSQPHLSHSLPSVWIPNADTLKHTCVHTHIYTFKYKMTIFYANKHDHYIYWNRIYAWRWCKCLHQVFLLLLSLPLLFVFSTHSSSSSSSIYMIYESSDPKGVMLHWEYYCHIAKREAIFSFLLSSFFLFSWLSSSCHSEISYKLKPCCWCWWFCSLTPRHNRLQALNALYVNPIWSSRVGGFHLCLLLSWWLNISLIK